MVEVDVPEMNVVFRVREDYLKRFARRLRWSFEDVVSGFNCEKVGEGVYECYLVKVTGNKVYISPYTIAMVEKLRDIMYRHIG